MDVLESECRFAALCQEGFNAQAPELPKLIQNEAQPQARAKLCSLRLTLSLATANVQSLQRHGAAQHGHPGKIQYLREQFKAHGLQVLGIQEARAPQMCGMSDNVLRISSGHQKGMYGTELWFDLDRPYGYVGRQALRFARHQFAVLFADPRILIVRAQAELFHAIFVAAHAPHSGYSRQDREQWWQHLSIQISESDVREGENLYVMIDANASSGPCDNQHVGPRDDQVTANTGLFVNSWKSMPYVYQEPFQYMRALGKRGPHLMEATVPELTTLLFLLHREIDVCTLQCLTPWTWARSLMIMLRLVCNWTGHVRLQCHSQDLDMDFALSVIAFKEAALQPALRAMLSLTGPVTLKRMSSTTTRRCCTILLSDALERNRVPRSHISLRRFGL